MLRTEFAQTVVREILSGRIYDLVSCAMALPIKLLGGETSKQRYEIADDLTICVGDPVNKLMDENEAFVQLKEFVALWDYLERHGLVKGVHLRQPPIKRLIIFGADDAPHYTIMSLIYPYVNKHIVALPGLSEFVERGFLTDDEFVHQQETEGREAALRLTRRVAYISIGISLSIAFLTTLFNLLSYRSDRSVTITNPGAFVDTTKVLLINSATPLLRSNQSDSGSRVLQKSARTQESGGGESNVKP